VANLRFKDFVFKHEHGRVKIVCHYSKDQLLVPSLAFFLSALIIATSAFFIKGFLQKKL